MAAVQLGLSRCRGRLSGDYDNDIQNLKDMALWGSMAADLAFAMDLLKGRLTAAQIAREAKDVMPVATIPDGARPVIPAGVGSIRGKLADALSTLPRRQREVLILVEGQGLSPTEVASMLNIKRQSVEVHLARARERLMPILERDGRRRRQTQETKARQVNA